MSYKRQGKGRRPNSERKYQKELARFIKDRRNAIGLSVQDVADALAVAGYRYSKSGVAHWETPANPGRIPLDDPDFIYAFAEILRTTPLRFYEIAGIIPTGTVSADAATVALIHMLLQLSPDNRELAMKFMEFLSSQHHVD
jgi:transcriptional regulator with XRE-family HTH domain